LNGTAPGSPTRHDGTAGLTTASNPLGCMDSGGPSTDRRGSAEIQRPFTDQNIPDNAQEFSNFVNENVPNRGCGEAGSGSNAAGTASPYFGKGKTKGKGKPHLNGAISGSPTGHDGASGFSSVSNPFGSMDSRGPGMDRRSPNQIQRPFTDQTIPNNAQDFSTFVNSNVPNRGCGETGTDGPPARRAVTNRGRADTRMPPRGGLLRTVSRDETRLHAGDEPGWSGPGERGLIRTHILPEALRYHLDKNGRVAMRFAGSYERHTAFCYADIDIQIITDNPVTSIQRQLILRRLENHKNLYAQEHRHFGGAQLSLHQYAVKVTLPKIKKNVEYGADEYDIVFVNRADFWPPEEELHPSLRGSHDRIEADKILLDFYRGNTGAQNVARLIKYATYNLQDRMSGVLVDSFVKRVAEAQGFADGPSNLKATCTERQHELYSAVVEEFRRGLSSQILQSMLSDADCSEVRDSTSRMIHDMSGFYAVQWNREKVNVKKSPARPWNNWTFLGNPEVEIVARTSEGNSSSSNSRPMPDPWFTISDPWM